jgi:hypothetical protein
MATIQKKKLASETQFGGTAYGNATTLPFNLTTNAVGAAVNSDTATGIALGDKVRIGILPAGAILNDSSIVVSDAFTALVTANVGFEYVDGVDVAAVPQNASYFGAAVTLHTLGRYRNVTTNSPVKLPKDAYLILTTAGAANASIGIADVIINTVLNGAP